MHPSLKRAWVFHAAAALLFAGELLLPGRSLFRWDALLYNWPILLETRSQILSGHWPFWADAFCNGTPLLENINAGVLYPLRIVTWLLPLPFGYHLFLFLHVWLSFVGMHLLLARGLRLRGWAPYAGALIYGASGYARGMWDTHNFMALPWIPLALAALFMERPRAAVFGVALAWGMLVLCGDFQAACLWPGVALLLILFDARRRVFLPRLLAGLLWGLALTAVQWMPAAAAASESYRAGGMDLSEALERSYHPVRLLDLLLPYFWGNRDTWRGMHLMGEGATKLSPWTCSVHIGLLSLALIAFALRTRRPGANWARVVALGSILLSFGRFLPGFSIWQSLPVISSFRYPEKYWLWATLALAALAALGTGRALAWARSFFPRGALLAVCFILSLLIPWYMERPTTTAFNPLEAPLVVKAIRDSDHPDGRVFRDPALVQVPLPASFSGARPSVRQSMFYRESLTFNSPRLWGCRTADGFSPTEPGIMRRFRFANGTPSDGPPSDEQLARFCRLSSVAWLLTSPDRLAALREQGLPIEPHTGWGSPEAVVLAQIRDPEPGVWRPRPGFIRVDLPAGSTATLVRVSETFAPGWRAADQHGNPLSIQCADEAFVGVTVGPDVKQIRLSYEPRHWALAVSISAISLLCLMAYLIPLRPALVGAVLFLGVGLAARSHWSCTFDEGFHVARGTALVASGDSRLSYFHPPLQNKLCGYFAWLAQGDRLRLPELDGDIWNYSVDLAAAQPDRFPDLVRASRWGSLLLGLILVAVGVRCAQSVGGPLAGWMAAFGLALNPNLLAHGNLTTTDIGVTALAIAGLCAALRDRDGWAMACFVAAALTKFTGLIWLISFSAVCLFRRRHGWILAGAVLFVAGLLALYGSEWRVYISGIGRQAGHAWAGHKAFFHGETFVQSRWWHPLAAVVLKMPPLWLLASLAAALWGFRKVPRETLITLAPLFVFAVLLCFANRMAIGVRHALPLMAGGIIGAAVWTSQLKRFRAVAAAALIVSSLWTAGAAYPHYLSYFPAWAGGVRDGYRWLVDSNYDWGQDLEELELSWAALTEANGGRPPRLIYYGFADPARVCRMPVAEGSYGGFMSWQEARRSGNTEAWRAALSRPDGPVVASISALRLDPHGIPFSRLRAGRELGRIGNSFYVLDTP